MSEMFTRIYGYVLILLFITIVLFKTTPVFDRWGSTCAADIDEFAGKCGVISASSEATSVANQFIQAAQRGDYTAIAAMIDKKTIEHTLALQLVKALEESASGQELILSKNDLVGFRSCSVDRQVAVRFMHEIQPGKSLLVDLVYEQLRYQNTIIKDLSFSVVNGYAPSKFRDFSFTNLSTKQTCIGIIYLTIPLLILAVLIMYMRMEKPKRKLSWMVFILFGIGSIGFDWTGQMFFTKPFSISLLGIGWLNTDCSSPLVLQFSLPIGAMLFLLKIYLPHCKNPMVVKLLARYNRYRDEKRAIAEAKWKRHCLSEYGVYNNADELTREEMLKVFWKILKRAGYEVSAFNGDTNVQEPAEQPVDWDDNGDAEFIFELENIFGFSRDEIFDKKQWHVKTFGELADLMINKAKEKKLLQSRGDSSL